MSVSKGHIDLDIAASAWSKLLAPDAKRTALMKDLAKGERFRFPRQESSEVYAASGRGWYRRVGDGARFRTGMRVVVVLEGE